MPLVEVRRRREELRRVTEHTGSAACQLEAAGRKVSLEVAGYQEEALIPWVVDLLEFALRLQGHSGLREGRRMGKGCTARGRGPQVAASWKAERRPGEADDRMHLLPPMSVSAVPGTTAEVRQEET